jgi:hypothetical protein
MSDGIWDPGFGIRKNASNPQSRITNPDMQQPSCNTACPPSSAYARSGFGETPADECCGRKKLPFAEYSVVKDQTRGATPPDPRSLTRRDPQARLRSLAKARAVRNTEVAKLITSALRPERVSPKLDTSQGGRAQRPERTSAREGLMSLTRIAESFFKEPDPPSRDALRRTTFAPLACQPKLVVVHRAKVGGEYRARTGDLLVANQALSQLS